MLLIQLLHRLFPLPLKVRDNECIARCVFSPMNVDTKTGKLQANFFSPRLKNGSEEGISVIRRNYARIHFVKHHCICNSNPNEKRGYYGIAWLFAKDIRSCKCDKYPIDIISTPLDYQDYSLPQHADIFYGGYIPEKGVTLPLEAQRIRQKLRELANWRADSNPKSKYWNSGYIDYLRMK